MAQTENCILTNMCLIYRNDEILMQKREKKDWPGFTLPGGHVEKGENLNDAIIREVYEETGLMIKNPILCGIEEFKTKDEDRYFIFFYKTNEFSGELRDSDEGKVFWIKQKDLNKKDMSMDIDLILEVINNDKLSELVYYKQNGEWLKKLL